MSPARYALVEQLNRAQWCASSPVPDWPTGGVQNYVGAIAEALWMVTTTSLGVMSIDLNGEQMVLLAPGGEA